MRLHEGRARTASFEEMLLLGSAAVVAGGRVFVTNLFTITVPRSVPIIATVVFLVFASWGRAMWRRVTERDLDELDAASGPPSRWCSSARARLLAS